MGRPERSIIALGGGIVILVLIAFAIVLAFGSPEVQEFPPDSPEGTVQRYLRALHDGDDEAALDLLSERARREIDRNGYPHPYYCPRQDGRTIRVARVDRGDQRATVVLSIQDLRGSGLSFDRSTWEYPVRLVFENDEWKIDDTYVCV